MPEEVAGAPVMRVQQDPKLISTVLRRRVKDAVYGGKLRFVWRRARGNDVIALKEDKRVARTR